MSPEYASLTSLCFDSVSCVTFPRPYQLYGHTTTANVTNMVWLTKVQIRFISQCLQWTELDLLWPLKQKQPDNNLKVLYLVYNMHLCGKCSQQWHLWINLLLSLSSSFFFLLRKKAIQTKQCFSHFTCLTCYIVALVLW